MAAPAYGVKVTAFPRPPEPVKPSSKGPTVGLNLSTGEKARLAGWLIASGCSGIGWIVYLWKADPSEVTPGWLLPAILGTVTALGLLGGMIVPRRGASWLALLAECAAGAGAIGAGCFLTFIHINVETGSPDHPFLLGVSAALVTGATFVVLCPTFFCAYGLRAMVIRAARFALGSAPRA